MRGILNRLLWLKWTVYGWLSLDREALPCGCYKGRKSPHHMPNEPCLVDRPGDDDQWEEWIEERETHE